MNSILYYLSQLPSTIRDKAIANHEKDTHFDKRRKVDGIPEALNYAFVWFTSEEGIEYWQEFHEKLLECEHELGGTYEDIEEGIGYLCLRCKVELQTPHFD